MNELNFLPLTVGNVIITCTGKLGIVYKVDASGFDRYPVFEFLDENLVTHGPHFISDILVQIKNNQKHIKLTDIIITYKDLEILNDFVRQTKNPHHVMVKHMKELFDRLRKFI